MAKLLKIIEMTPDELVELGTRKTDWWLVAKDVMSYIEAHPNKPFVVWLNDSYKFPDNAANCLKTAIKRIAGGDDVIENYRFKGVNAGSKTKIGMTRKG